MNPTPSNKIVLDGARWLISSGIQHLHENSRFNGGVAAWYDLSQKTYPYLYSEITGYAISMFVFLNRITGDGRYLHHAKLASDWILRQAIYRGGGIRTRLYLNEMPESHVYDFESGRIFTFDSSIVGYGLLQLYKKSKQVPLLAAADQIANFMTTYLKKSDGTFYPYYDLQKQMPGESLDKWSDQFSGFHAKLALFFIDFYQVTGKASFKLLAEDLLALLAKEQLDSGRFITHRNDQSTHHHPHSYALEGFLYAGIKLKRKDYLEVVQKGLEWLLRGIQSDGSVATLYRHEQFLPEERLDIVAQALRLSATLYGLKVIHGRQWLVAMGILKERLLQYQHKDKSDQAGGFYFSAQSEHLNAWVSMFAIQAIWMYDSFVKEETPVTVDAFV